MFGVGFIELLIIAVFALVFVGPKRLPEVMRQAGRLFVHLRRTANDVRSTFDQVIRDAENELRREEAESLRNALKPVQDAHREVKALLSGTPLPPSGASPPAQSGVLQSSAGAPPLASPSTSPSTSPLTSVQAGQTVDTTATSRVEATPSTPAGSVPYTPGGAPAAAPHAAPTTPAEAAGTPAAPAAPDTSGAPKETV